MDPLFESPPPTPRARLDELVGRLRDGARGWAKAGIAERLRTAREMRSGIVQVAERSVLAACEAKGIAPGSPQEGEEWVGGPYVTTRMLRLTIESLEQIGRTGTTAVGPSRRTGDGRLAVRVYPMSLLDRMILNGLTAEVILREGAGERELEERARFYRAPDHEGRVALVLGAGNVNSIAPTDLVAKLFNEGKVCLLKMNPVNAYLGPFLEEAFADAIGRGLIAVAYGGAEEGGYLCQHPSVDEVHITGSDKTHDLIVWGPPGPDRSDRMATGRPLLQKEMTSELGNISPVIVVPAAWSEKDLAFQAEQIAGQLTNNASFNCLAGKMLITAKGWPQAEELRTLILDKAGAVPARTAWYPGAEERFQVLTQRKALRMRGERKEGRLPWTLVEGLDAGSREELAFSVEPFCSILSSVELEASDPVEFLERAVAFANDRLWGTLSACLVAEESSLASPEVGRAIDRAVVRLRYGTVAVNCWPGVGFALGVTPWGAAPGSPLTDIQSGRGWVHNTQMLEHVEKCVLRMPTTSYPKPPYFPTHRTAQEVGRLLARFEEAPGLWRVGPIAAAAVRG